MRFVRFKLGTFESTRSRVTFFLTVQGHFANNYKNVDFCADEHSEAEPDRANSRVYFAKVYHRFPH